MTIAFGDYTIAQTSFLVNENIGNREKEYKILILPQDSYLFHQYKISLMLIDIKQKIKNKQSYS